MKDELMKKEKELQEQRQIDQKREKKSIRIFAIVIVIALMVGVGAGIIAGALKGVITYWSMYALQIREVLAIIVPSIMVCMNVGMAIVCFTQCRKLKRQIADWKTKTLASNVPFTMVPICALVKYVRFFIRFNPFC